MNNLKLESSSNLGRVTLERNNLLLAVHKYAHQQDENFTTEALVHLLRHLQAFESDIAASVLAYVSGGQLKLTGEDCARLEVTTQNLFMEGRPDILIVGPEQFVIIEVKVESGLGPDQLDRYREILKGRTESLKCLVLLSRYSTDPAQTFKVDCHIRWYRLARILGQALGKMREATSLYLAHEFLEFLNERGMVMEKVGWELVHGVRSLVSLMDMLGEAVTATKVREKKASPGGEYCGRYFFVDDTECWCGIYYVNPQLLTFEAYEVNKAGAEAVGFGRVLDQRKGSFKWISEIDLESEQVHFFALSPDSQQSRIQRFIAEHVSAVRKMCP